MHIQKTQTSEPQKQQHTEYFVRIQTFLQLENLQFTPYTEKKTDISLCFLSMQQPAEDGER